MASTRSFFAHRLGHRDVDCEKGYGCGGWGRDVAARGYDVISETGDNWCTDSERKHTWRHRCDVESFPPTRSTSLPLNQFHEPPALTSHIISSSCLPSGPLLRTKQNATRASVAASNHTQGGGDTVPPLHGQSQSGPANRGKSHSQGPAKLLILDPAEQCSLADGASRKTSFSRHEAVIWTEDQTATSASFPNTLALDQALHLQGGRSVPTTLSKSANFFSIGPARPSLAVIPSSNGPHLEPFNSPQRLSVFSFFSQHSQSVAASLIRLEKTILKYEGAIFEILNAQASLDLSRDIPSKHSPGSLLPTVQTASDGELSTTAKMSNPFRSSSGKTIPKEPMSNPFRFSNSKATPKEPRDTPPRAIFSDYPAAHSAITNVPSAKGEKIPSPTLGLPAIENPYANLPPTIDLPDTPAKHTGGPASEDLKARIASSEYPAVDIPERPETPLLPLTPVLTPPDRSENSSEGGSQLCQQPPPEDCHLVGKNSYELKVLKRDTRNDRSHVDNHDRECESSRVRSHFELGTPSPSSASRATQRHLSRHPGSPTDVHQSSTLDSIIGRYNDDSVFLQMREGSQRSIEISNSHEVSSLSADDDGEVGFHDSTAGHTPPLAYLMLARKGPERSTSGQPPRDPLPDVPARQAFRDPLDTAGSEPTNYGHTRELLDITSEFEEGDAAQAAGPAEHSRRRGLVFKPRSGIPAKDRLMLAKPACIPAYRNLSDREREILESSASGGSPPVRSEHGIGIDDRREGFVERLLQPLAYRPNSDDRRLASVGPGRPPPLVAHNKEDGQGGYPPRLCRQPSLDPGPTMTQFGRFMGAAGGPQSSSSQGLNAGSSLRQGRVASGRFQHDETLASLTGEVPQGSHRNMESLIKDVGGMFGAAEEYDGAVFDKDEDEEEDDDADWETLHESGLKARIPLKRNTNRGETAASLTRLSSHGRLTGSVPATPWDPLTGRARVLRQPPRAALSHKSRVQTDTETGLPGMWSEYGGSGWHQDREEDEMARRVHPRVLDRPFPAFATTSQPPAIPQMPFHAPYRHPEPMSEEHKHPFSLAPPSMAPTHHFRTLSPTNPGTARNEILGVAEHAEDGEGAITPTGLVLSKKRNTQQISALATGESLESNMRDSRELSRPSNLSVDGSYSGSSHSGPALSTSSIMHDSQYLPQPTGTFSKCTILGPKGNITGSFDGTGMRAVGSSEADYSTDSAMMRSHKYERLDDERTLDQAPPSAANTTAAQSTPKTPKKVTFAETSEMQMAAAAPVMTKSGLSISAPKEFKIPTTVPKRNSFAISTLNTAKRLDECQTLTTTPLLFDYDYDNDSRELHLEKIRGLIEMSADDWKRLQSKCMTFPLRVDHLNDTLELDGVSTGQKQCYRDNMQPDGRYMESAKCDNCNRWERSHAAVLVRRPFNKARAATQQEIGRRIVFWSTVLPFIGWGFLFVIANRMEASNDLIAGFTRGVIREFGDAEIEAADFYFKCIVGVLLLLFLALLVFTIVIVTQS